MATYVTRHETAVGGEITAVTANGGSSYTITIDGGDIDITSVVVPAVGMLCLFGAGEEPTRHPRLQTPLLIANGQAREYWTPTINEV